MIFKNYAVSNLSATPRTLNPADSISTGEFNISLKDNSNELSQNFCPKQGYGQKSSLNNNIMCPFAFGSQINKFAPSRLK